MKRFFLFLILLSFLLPVGHVQASDSIPLYLPRIVKISSESELDSLSNQGVDILRRRGDLLLCFFPNVSTRSNESAFRRRPIGPALDVAKSHFDAVSIQKGSAVGTSYTGRGIVVGICDIGIDPLHPTFLDEDGRSRIKRVVQYVEDDGMRIQLDGDEDYRQWGTDNPDKYHATHVCGILAGNGAGTQYSGIASDAEIVVTVSTLTEVGLLAGVEDIIDYAKEVGKPAVINISVGSYTGPHDGSSLFSQYLDMCAEEAVIVLSAGNEGKAYNSLVSTFTSDRSWVAFRLGNTAWDEFKMYGVTEIWSDSDAPLQVALGIYDSNQKNIVKWDTPVVLAAGESRSYVWDGTEVVEDGFPYVGELDIKGYVDPENGRYCTVIGYDFTAEEQSTQGPWARYELAVKVLGEPGRDVEVYADGIYTRLSGVAGSVAPSTDHSVSDLACGFKVISVGMYTNNDSVAGASSRSSYGTLRDGRVLPLTVAPGFTLISSGSRPFIECNPDHEHEIINGCPWINLGGTSMSSPYVAGYIATWLEAVPSLTVEDIMKILSETNRHDIPDSDDPRNASGYFDPVRGLRLALKKGEVISIKNPGDLLLPEDFVEVFDVAGKKIYAGAALGLSGMEKGLYVVRTPYGAMKMSLPR